MTELMPSLCNDCVARNQCGNDDVKMCISYTKETKIKCDDCKFVENCVDYGWKDCKKFTPKPSEQMTNEEYLRSCNTEQLAEWLGDTFDLCGAGCSKCFIKELCFDEHNNKMPTELFVEWLKQPHQ